MRRPTPQNARHRNRNRRPRNLHRAIATILLASAAATAATAASAADSVDQGGQRNATSLGVGKGPSAADVLKAADVRAGMAVVAGLQAPAMAMELAEMGRFAVVALAPDAAARAVEELLGMKWHAFRYKDGAYQIIPWPDEKHPVFDEEQGTVDPKLLIRKATDVPEAERKKLFWVAERELVTAWLKLHNVKNKAIGIPQ